MTSMNQSGQSTPSNGVPTEGGQQTDAPGAWLIRAGRNGERYDYNIEHSLVGLGWGQMPDLRSFSSRKDLETVLRLRLPDASDRSITNHVGQLWRLRTDVRVDDLVVMPRKGTPEMALGTVTREYWYDDGDPGPDWRHLVSVDWKRTDVPRTDVRGDLLKSLDGLQTIYSIHGNDGPWRLQQLLETGQDPGARESDATGSESDLPTLVEQFIADTGYATEEHEEQKRLREEWARKLAPENILSLSRADLRAFTNNSVDYSQGQYIRQVKGESKWISDLDDTEYLGLLNNINDICCGQDELSVRIDRYVDYHGYRRDAGTRGFPGSNVGGTLAICHPDRFIPISSQRGRKWGRVAMLRRLGLPDARGSTFGQHVVDANDRLREHLAPHLGNDTQAMGIFLHWLRERDDASSASHVESDSRSEPDLDGLAKELLINAQFLKDIVDLLADKGQVILYGPPGTGKTYLARELASELAPDESCRTLVQFHPSTSYEDFFEGYRPAGTVAEGGIRYELTPGPLVRMAERADAAPNQRHVMIIDEINRGNLPRVLGELLFLLEYRDESVNTLYRTEELFALPKNLWFIGTMNTADRSIALVDAALRRRFHFVPFFPDREPMAGLLQRWLKRKEEPLWVGELVDAINGELKDVLEGSHLLLGPSHFMKEYGFSDSEQRSRLRRIWQYNIEPFIEDQFFGDPDQIERFRFDAVMTRHGPRTLSQSGPADDPDELPDSVPEGGDDSDGAIGTEGDAD